MTISPDPSPDHLWITVLAGGIGSRFWPVSTRSRPKQLLPLASDDPLIHDTVERARALVPEERLRILAGDHLLEPFRTAVPGLSRDAFLIEPRARGTAPVLAWAAWTLERLDPDAVLVSLHADHLIRPLEAFRSTVLGAAEVASRDELLLTVGAAPDRPETGYGYIQPGPSLEPPAADPGSEPRRVGAFHEKPDQETAARYVEEGYLWNTGIFVWKAAVFLEELRRHAPEVAEPLALLEEEGARAYFDAVPKISVDVAVMERSERVGVVPAGFEWDDVGAWHAVHRSRPGDAEGNVVVGDGLVVDGRDNVIWTEEGPVVLFGLDDVVVVRAGGRVLVASRERTADLKTLLDELPPHVRGPD